MKQEILQKISDFVNIISLEKEKKVDISNFDSLRFLATPQALYRLNKKYPLKAINETIYRIKNTGAYIKVKKARYNRAFYCEFYNLKQYNLSDKQEYIKNEMINYLLEKKSFKLLSIDIALDDKKPLKINPFFIQGKNKYKDTLYLSILGQKACIYNKYNKNPLKVNENIIRSEITLNFCNFENTSTRRPAAAGGKKTPSKNIKWVTLKSLRGYINFKCLSINKFLNFHEEKTKFKQNLKKRKRKEKEKKRKEKEKQLFI